MIKRIHNGERDEQARWDRVLRGKNKRRDGDPVVVNIQRGAGTRCEGVTMSDPQDLTEILRTADGQ